jgi:actin-related protein
MLPLHKLVHRSLSQLLDADLRKELASNIILTGSASLFPGLDKSLSIELGKVLPASYKHKVISSKSTVENRYGAWIGGSILSSLGSFQQLWLSKKEYEENGALLGLQRFNNN